MSDFITGLLIPNDSVDFHPVERICRAYPVVTHTHYI